MTSSAPLAPPTGPPNGAPPSPAPATTEAERRAKLDAARAQRGQPAGSAKRATHRWARWLHVYTSMVALVIVLFFGITGITLNHPDWTFGDDLQVTTEQGTLPFDATLDDGSVDFLSISEFARDSYGVAGEIDSFQAQDGQGSIVYKKPGYAAEIFFDTDAGTYELTVEQQGWVAVLNDLHKGRDAGGAWKWVIDVSAGFLVAISLTGLTMQLFLRKRRRSALLVAGAGLVVTVILTWITLG